MKATKFRVTVEIEVLSTDTIDGMLERVQERLAYGIHTGENIADDGDYLRWETTETKVEF